MEKIFRMVLTAAAVIPFLGACNPPAAAQLKDAVPVVSVTEAPTLAQPTLDPGTPLPSTVSSGGEAFPLSEPGPYHVGLRRMISFSDASRGDREVSLTIWYPAQKPQDTDAAGPTPDALPDPSGGPYPLILSSTKVGFIFAKTLASYGFVVVGVNGIDTYNPWDENLVDQPLDILFVLDQVSTQPIAGLEGMIDSTRAGAMGYSFDGYNALALSGARVDPEAYLAACNDLPLPDSWDRFGYCYPREDWEDFESHAGEALTTSDDGLWQPMTDKRIQAVMPMAPEGVALFGARGLAAVDRALLIIGATKDDDCNYQGEAVYIYDHVGTNEKSLISFVGQDHMMILNADMITRMAHFAVAFFVHQLQGRHELAYYYSPEYVNQQQGLVWGPYPSE